MIVTLIISTTIHVQNINFKSIRDWNSVPILLFLRIKGQTVKISKQVSGTNRTSQGTPTEQI